MKICITISIGVQYTECNWHSKSISKVFLETDSLIKIHDWIKSIDEKLEIGDAIFSNIVDE